MDNNVLKFKSVIEKFKDKSILIAGFGREGRSTYTFLRKILPDQTFTIADKNTINDTNFVKDPLLSFKTGEDYLQNIDGFDFIIKTPGISTLQLGDIDKNKITSQTDIFLSLLANNVIGITGTKGKSTTTSLIYNLLHTVSPNTILVGNIGIPPFDCIDKIDDKTYIVCELSSHQLEYIHTAPHIAILLNIYKEHLDHYYSYEHYQQAKLNITLKQKITDYFIYNADNEIISSYLKHTGIKRNFYPFSENNMLSNGLKITDDYIFTNKKPYYNVNDKRYLKGKHNLLNIAAMIQVARILNINTDIVHKTIAEFKGLEHRLEFVIEKNGITFYNDSISTIPEATIQAVKALQNVDTLILGGFDRGIDYTGLADFLSVGHVRNLIFLGEAGKRIFTDLQKVGLNNLHCYFPLQFVDVVTLAFEKTKKGKICLLSPAAASYDSFKNFEERGQIFKQLINEYVK